MKKKKKKVKKRDAADARSSYFTGGTFRMFLYMMALYLGTVFSIGIAYPWLACRYHRWEADNTYINGRRQYFDGRGGDLFKRYIKWLLLTLVTLGLYKFVLTKKVMMWRISHTGFAGCSTELSCYRCGTVEKLVMLIKYYAIIIFTLTLGKPWANCFQQRWTMQHTVISGSRLTFTGKGLQYTGTYFLVILLILVTLGVYALFCYARIKRWEVKHTVLSNQ